MAIGEDKGNEKVEGQAGFGKESLPVGGKPGNHLRDMGAQAIGWHLLHQERLLDEAVDQIKAGEAVLARPFPVDADKASVSIRPPVPWREVPVDERPAHASPGEACAGAFVQEREQIANQSVVRSGFPFFGSPGLEQGNRVDVLFRLAEIGHCEPDGAVPLDSLANVRDAGMSPQLTQCFLFAPQGRGIFVEGGLDDFKSIVGRPSHCYDAGSMRRVAHEDAGRIGIAGDRGKQPTVPFESAEKPDARCGDPGLEGLGTIQFRGGQSHSFVFRQQQERNPPPTDNGMPLLACPDGGKEVVESDGQTGRIHGANSSIVEAPRQLPCFPFRSFARGSAPHPTDRANAPPARPGAAFPLSCYPFCIPFWTSGGGSGRLWPVLCA